MGVKMQTALLNKKNEGLKLFEFWAIFFAPIVLLLSGADVYMTLIVELIIYFTFECFHNITKNIFLLCFLLSLFGFLVSGDLVSDLFGRNYAIIFSQEVEDHAHLCIIISLMGVWIGYRFFRTRSCSPIRCGEKSETKTYKKLVIRRISYVLYLVAYVVLIINTIDKVIFVSNNGYVQYYVSYSSFLPGIIAEIGDFAPIALVIFLATMPSKRACKLPLFTYFIYAVLTFFMGTRGTFIYESVFILCYIIYRNKDGSGVKWIHRWQIIGIIACVPVLLLVFQLYGYIRLGTSVQYNSVFDSILDFFVSTGASSKVIKWGYVYQGEIVGTRLFSLGDTLNYFKYGKLFNLLTPENIIPVHSAQFAMESHSFDAFISYVAMGDRFLAGEGAGSSYIACLYADFGYIGVAIGSLIYGCLLKAISNLKSGGWLSKAIKLYMFMNLIKAPRGSFDAFFAGIFNLNFILIVFAVYFIANLYVNVKNERAEKKKNE